MPHAQISGYPVVSTPVKSYDHMGLGLSCMVT